MRFLKFLFLLYVVVFGDGRVIVTVGGRDS